MTDIYKSDPLYNPEKGKQYFANGKELKAKGHFDTALTEFRRAALADPNLFEAWMEIGALCRTKSNSDKMFLRYSFDAYKKAVKLEPDKQEAHDQYIVTGQMSGKLGEINEEYRQLNKKFPDNPLFIRCYKNTSQLLMAMMPDKVDLGQADNAKKVKRMVTLVSLGLIFVGACSTIAPVVLVKGLKIALTQGVMKQIMNVGIGMIFFGVGGFVFKARMPR